jgi:hypothetical protein
MSISLEIVLTVPLMDPSVELNEQEAPQLNAPKHWTMESILQLGQDAPELAPRQVLIPESEFNIKPILQIGPLGPKAFKQ